MARQLESKASKQNGGKAASKASLAQARRKKSRSLITNMALGVGFTIAALVGASMVTVATSVKSAPSIKFETALLAPPLARQHLLAASAPVADRNLDVSKFSRLPGSAPAEPKRGRLEGAELAALSSQRPDDASVRQSMHLAMAKAARHAETEQQFAALGKLRPGSDQIKSALGSAMESLVVVAPRGNSALGAMPDILQEVQPATQVAELNTMKPVELASLESDLPEAMSDDAVAIAEQATPLPTPAPASLAQTLPKAGPLPVLRPGAATVSASIAAASVKPERPNGLAAIAAVAPQKPGRGDSDNDKPTVLAFAKPNNPMREEPVAPSQGSPKWPGIGTKVAIYDITNGVVIMPNGSRLEAHSGIGSMRDNPKFTHVKMRGPTPPGTYKLSMRESLFHGVAAIRLTPTDGKAPQGRTGLLAHSFLLRVRGDSHGCVAFADYDKFLKAFQRGEITHMVIVPKWDGRRPGSGPSGGGIMAKLFGNKDA
jgi:hypothetical protein